MVRSMESIPYGSGRYNQSLWNLHQIKHSGTNCGRDATATASFQSHSRDDANLEECQQRDRPTCSVRLIDCWWRRPCHITFCNDQYGNREPFYSHSTSIRYHPAGSDGTGGRDCQPETHDHMDGDSWCCGLRLAGQQFQHGQKCHPENDYCRAELYTSRELGDRSIQGGCKIA